MIYYVSPTFYCCGVHRRINDSFCYFSGRERRARHPLALGLLVRRKPRQYTLRLVAAMHMEHTARGTHR